MTYHAQTRVVPVDPQQPDPAILREAAAVLRRGGLVAFPTETVYGLGANALDADAVARIFAAKGRPASDPVIVHVAALAQVETVARRVPPLALALAGRFWPGPLTLVLERADAVPASVTAGGPSVGVRMPRHPVAQALLRLSPPIAAPSANLFARPSPTTAAHVLDDLAGRVDLILDGGPTDVGVESTVLDLTTEPPRVLRPGGISLEALREVIPDVQLTTRYLREDETAAGPGMLLKHYAPRARLTLYTGPAESALAAMRAEALRLAAQGQQAGILAAAEDLPRFAGLPVQTAALGTLADLDGIARNLFAALRALDATGVDAILARDVPRTGVGLAIWDRLVRAAEGRVVETDQGDP